jgi:hypothetical protein
MSYARPVSFCDGSATDLAAEIVAALSSSSMVLKEDKDYSEKLVQAAENIYEAVTKEDPKKQGTYTVYTSQNESYRFYSEKNN